MEAASPGGAPASPFLVSFDPWSFTRLLPIRAGDIELIEGIFPAGPKCPPHLPHLSRSPEVAALLDEARSKAIKELRIASDALAHRAGAERELILATGEFLRSR